MHPVKREGIEAALVQEYDAPVEIIRADLADFLNRMIELGLLAAPAS
jgi:hypothetical protein